MKLFEVLELLGDSKVSLMFRTPSLFIEVKNET